MITVLLKTCPIEIIPDASLRLEGPKKGGTTALVAVVSQLTYINIISTFTMYVVRSLDTDIRRNCRVSGRREQREVGSSIFMLFELII